MGFNNCTILFLVIVAVICSTLFEPAEASLVQRNSTERVSVKIGHYLQPLLNETDEALVLQNKYIVVQFKCLASYPTEWVFNDDNLSPNFKQRLRVEWTDRKFYRSIYEQVYDYIAWIQLQYNELVETEEFTCRSVENPTTDFVRVRLQPNNNGEVQITYERAREVLKDFSVPALKTTVPKGSADDPDPDNDLQSLITSNSSSSSTSSPSCRFEFTFVHNAEGYYWNCRDNKLAVEGNITFHDCRYSAAQCANSFRAIKQLDDNCIRVLNYSSSNATVAASSDDHVNNLGSWFRMENDQLQRQIPGVAVCTIDNKRRAVEYFYAGLPTNDLPKTPDALGQREIYFSWNDVNPVDLITMTTLNDYYTPDDTIEVACRVPKYGFSFDPVFMVESLSVNNVSGQQGTANTTSIVLLERGFVEDHESQSWIKRINLTLSQFGPGEYLVQCIAPIWNTTEWVFKTQAIQIQEIREDVCACEDKVISSRLESVTNQLQSTKDSTDFRLRQIETILHAIVSNQERQLQIQTQLLAAVTKQNQQKI